MTDAAPPAPDLMDVVHASPNPAMSFEPPPSVLPPLPVPSFTYLNTQAWFLDVGIPRVHLGEAIAAFTGAQADGGEAS